MWVFLRDSFISIGQHDGESRLIKVEARIRGDIERVFPEADVAENESADYRFSAAIHRDRVAQALSLRASQIAYTDFVGSMESEDDDRREAYITVWARMAEEQSRLYPTESQPEPVEDELEAPIASSHRFDLEV